MRTPKRQSHYFTATCNWFVNGCAALKRNVCAHVVSFFFAVLLGARHVSCTNGALTYFVCCATAFIETIRCIHSFARLMGPPYREHNNRHTNKRALARSHTPTDSHKHHADMASLRISRSLLLFCSFFCSCHQRCRADSYEKCFWRKTKPFESKTAKKHTVHRSRL